MALHYFQETLEMVTLLSKYHIPIMATGGISTSDHIKQLRKAGASLFGIATQLIQDPYQIPHLNNMLRN